MPSTRDLNSAPPASTAFPFSPIQALSTFMWVQVTGEFAKMQSISTDLGRKSPVPASPVGSQEMADSARLETTLGVAELWDSKQLHFSAPLGSPWTPDGFKLLPLLLQKLREFLEGSNLITKLQAKHDLLQRTLGEGRSPGANGGNDLACVLCDECSLKSVKCMCMCACAFNLGTFRFS